MTVTGVSYFWDVDDDMGPDGTYTQRQRPAGVHVMPVMSLRSIMHMNRHCWLDVLKVRVRHV